MKNHPGQETEEQMWGGHGTRWFGTRREERQGVGSHRDFRRKEAWISWEKMVTWSSSRFRKIRWGQEGVQEAAGPVRKLLQWCKRGLVTVSTCREEGVLTWAWRDGVRLAHPSSGD